MRVGKIVVPPMFLLSLMKWQFIKKKKKFISKLNTLQAIVIHKINIGKTSTTKPRKENGR